MKKLSEEIPVKIEEIKEFEKERKKTKYEPFGAKSTRITPSS